MRVLVCVILCTCLSISNLLAQEKSGKWQLAKYGASINFENENIRVQSSNHFLDQVNPGKFWRTPIESMYATGYNETYQHLPELAFSFTFTNPRFEYWEWRNNIGYKHNIIGAITYYGVPLQPGCPPVDQMIISKNRQELVLESALGRVIEIVDGLNITPSMGTNIGISKVETSVREELYVGTPIDLDLHRFTREYDVVRDEELGANTMFNQRVFIDLKGSLMIKNSVEVFAAGRFGTGYRVGDGDALLTHNSMLSFGINWILNKKV